MFCFVCTKRRKHKVNYQTEGDKMGRMNRPAYERIIRENIEWLDKQPRSLESDHIRLVLKDSIDRLYPTIEHTVFKAGDKVLLEAEIVSEEQKPFEYKGQAWIRINGAGGIFKVPLSTLQRRSNDT